jgi:hypothetical protein
MSDRTRTQITIHTRQRLVVHALPNSLRTWCEHCAGVVVGLTPDAIGAVLLVTRDNLDDLLSSGSVHSVSGGGSLICGNSLSNHTTENEISIEGEKQ